MKERFGERVNVGLKPGDGGIFDVWVDGKLLFSKHRLGRHAETGEVLGLIEKAGAPA